MISTNGIFTTRAQLESAVADYETYPIPIAKWDVSRIEDMSFLFYSMSDFCADLSKWDVSKVKNMSEMFGGAACFTSDLSAWDVSNVTNMSQMFGVAHSFNSDLSAWNVSNVTNMTNIFTGAESFNSDLSRWDVSNAINDVNGNTHAIIATTKDGGDVIEYHISGVYNRTTASALVEILSHTESIRTTRESRGANAYYRAIPEVCLKETLDDMDFEIFYDGVENWCPELLPELYALLNLD